MSAGVIATVLCSSVYRWVGLLMWTCLTSPILWNRVPNESFLNPYDVQNFRDFNVFAIMVSLFMNMFNVPAFYGNDTTNSGRTPHEQKMAGVIGAWRNGYAFLMIMMVAIITVVFMNGPQFAGKNRFGVSNNEIRRELAQRVLTDANLKMDEGVRARTLQAMAEMPDLQRVPGTACAKNWARRRRGASSSRSSVHSSASR